MSEATEQPAPSPTRITSTSPLRRFLRQTEQPVDDFPPSLYAIATVTSLALIGLAMLVGARFAWPSETSGTAAGLVAFIVLGGLVRMPTGLPDRSRIDTIDLFLITAFLVLPVDVAFTVSLVATVVLILLQPNLLQVFGVGSHVVRLGTLAAIPCIWADDWFAESWGYAAVAASIVVAWQAFEVVELLFQGMFFQGPGVGMGAGIAQSFRGRWPFFSTNLRFSIAQALLAIVAAYAWDGLELWALLLLFSPLVLQWPMRLKLDPPLA